MTLCVDHDAFLGRASATTVAGGKLREERTAMVLAVSFEEWSPTAVPTVFGSCELLCVLVAVGGRREATLIRGSGA